MPYNSKSSLIADQQLKVQELCVRFEDLGLYSASGSDVSVDVGEQVLASVSCLHLDNSGPDCLMIAAADRVLSDGEATDSIITVSLGAPLAANDVLILKYITQQ